MVQPVLKRAYRALSPFMPPLMYETLRMWRKLDYRPNIRYPRTFNEKIAYRKHYTRDQRFARLADKWTVREYVAEKIGAEYLTHVYLSISEINEKDLRTLPNSFVAKGRHDSRSTTIVEHKNREDWRLLLARFQAVLQKRMDPTLYEYWYNDIPAGLIFEERLRDARYFIPLDFKLFVFHGNVQYIQVIGGRHATLTQRFYDRSWRPLSVGRPGLALAPVIERPKQLSHMIEIAEALAVGFDFVRVDLYAPNDKYVVFGELTFAPASGRRPFIPASFDWKLGSHW